MSTAAPQPPAFRRTRRWLLLLLSAFLAYQLGSCLVWRGEIRPLRSGPGALLVPDFVGRPAAPAPLPAADLTQHPFMAASGFNNMHGTAGITNVIPAPGPLGRSPRLASNHRALLGGECASVLFDRRGRAVSVCHSITRAQLVLFDPHTLAELATFELPPRPSNRSLNLRKIMGDTSGGYFYLDHRDRAVIAAADLTVKIVAQAVRGGGDRGSGDREGEPEWELEQTFDLAPTVRRPASPGTPDRGMPDRGAPDRGDVVTSVLPDWQGRLWFVTRRGLVGTVDRSSGRVAAIELASEEIQNSFAVAPEAVYIVSDHALYRFEAAPDGAPEIVWRQVYDRGSRHKPGMINRGSGTTPTLLGDDLVAIADNADPQVNLLVYRRDREVEGDRRICQQPVFEAGRGAVENAMIGYRRSLVAANSYGVDILPAMVFGRLSEPGLVRLDLDPDGGCRVAWMSDEHVYTAMPRLSTATGLVYLYTKSPDAPGWIDAFYLTAVDFRSGETVWKTLAGTGFRFDNNWAPITLGPDGTAYVGTLNGLMAIRDGAGYP